LFYVVMGIFALYSFILIYALLRFGKSKILSLGVALFYFILITSLWSAALANFSQIPFELF
jgi:hypothetical protein